MTAVDGGFQLSKCALVTRRNPKGLRRCSPRARALRVGKWLWRWMRS